MEAAQSLAGLLAEPLSGKYLAIMAYVHETPEVESALAELRRRLVERYSIATTVGYGPRFLHSTGQLHKGGPNTGLFLQVTAGNDKDLPVSGKPYTFGVVSDAQALGDLQVLQSLGRHVTRIHSEKGDQVAIGQLMDQLP